MNTQASLQQKIFESAQRSRASYQETASAVAKLNLLAGNQFASNEEAIAFAETMNKAFVISGADTSEQSAAMRQMSQAMASGRLQGDEYNSIIENAPLVAQAIEKYMGVSRAELKELASEGQITADIIKAAVFSASGEINTQFEQMPMKFGDHMTQLKNNAIMALAPITERFQSIAASASFEQMMQRASTVIARGVAWLDNLLGKIEAIGQTQGFQQMTSEIGIALTNVGIVLGGIIDGALWLANIFTSNWAWISPIIWTVVNALIAYAAYLAISNTVTAISNTIKGIAAVISYAKATATGAETAATFAATAAQYGFNAALLACPLTWIILLFIAIITVFVIFTEEIVGAIWWLGALFKNIGLWFANLGLAIWEIIKNVGKWFANMGLGIWNVIKAAATNIGVAFKNAWITIQIGFWTMVDIIMQGLKSLAELANKTLGWMGVNIDTSGLDFAAKKIDELNAKKGEYVSVADAWSDAASTYEYGSVGDAFDTFDIFQDGWGSDAYSKGAEVGAGISDMIGGFLGDTFGGLTGTNPEEGSSQYEPVDYTGGFDPSQYTSGDSFNVDASGSEVSLSDEDIKYLKDIATLEYVNQYTSLRPTVQATFGDIRETADVNQVIQVFEDAIEAAYSSSLERS